MTFLRSMLAVAVLAASAPAVAATAAADPALATVLAGDWRAPEAKARDAARHPAEALAFWGLKPGMSILEIQPGGASWWTEILAPYARTTGGTFTATGADLDNPSLSEGARKSREAFVARYAARPEVYGTVGIVNWGAVSKPLPASSYDFILTARSVHGWMGQPGMTEKVFRELCAALKPGGTLAVEQHRANPGPQDPAAKSGYVTEAFVIAEAEKAGCKLVAKSEINANPKDTKDHPFGVWTLPPTRITVPYGSGQPVNPDFDHSKFDAIGESDRMTLRFTR